MATDATGTPTSKGIPKYNTVVDAPSGKGFNAAMDAIDTILSGYVVTPGSIATGETIAWNGSAWARSSVTRVTTIRPQDLAQDGAAQGQPMVWDGSKWAPGSLVLERRTASVDVVSSTSELTLYDGSAAGATGWNIPANTLGTDKMLRLTLKGDLLYNSSAANLTLKIKFGGTTFYANTVSTTNISANRQAWKMVVEVANLGATNSQIIDALYAAGLTDDGAPTTGIGLFSVRNINGAPAQPLGASALGTIDTTAAQKLDVTIQWGTNSASLSFRRRYAVLELV